MGLEPEHPLFPAYPGHVGHVAAAPPAFIHVVHASLTPPESFHVDSAVSHQDVGVGGDPGQLPAAPPEGGIHVDPLHQYPAPG